MNSEESTNILDHGNPDRPNLWVRFQVISDKVDKGLAFIFRSWAYFASKHPYGVIVFTTVFALLWGAGFYLQFAEELDAFDLFTPTDAESFDAKDYVDSVYGSYTDSARVLTVLKSSRNTKADCSQRLMLSNEEDARRNIREYFRFYQEIEKIEVEYKGEYYKLGDICIRAAGTDLCLVTSILDLWEYNATTIEAEDFNPLERINGGNLTTRFGLPFDVDYYLGRRDSVDCQEDPNLVSGNVEAFAMTLIYEYLREEVDGEEIDPESRAWVESLSSWSRKYSKFSILDSYVADENVVARESNAQLRKDVILLTIGYALIIAFTTIVLFKNSCLACKTHLSLASIVGICYALLSAYGIVQTLQIKFNLVVRVSPFLILGLGVDDTFVIVGAYQRVDPALPVPEKIARTLERAGSSIFVTSVTDFFAFLMGIYTELPAIRAFSIYVSTAVAFDFIYQMTFFVAFLVLEARREARYRNGCVRYGIVPCWKGSLFSEKDPDVETPPAFQEMTPKTNEVETTASPPSSSLNPWRKIYGKGNYVPDKPSISTKLTGSYLASLTLHPIGKIVVCFTEAVLLGLAIYGCTNVRTDFNLVDMATPNGSPLRTAFDLEDDFFHGNQVFFSVYTKQPDKDYFYYQDELKKLKTFLEQDEYVVPPVRTWFESYSNWLREDSPYSDQLINGSAPDPESFNEWLVEFLNTTSGQIFCDNLVMVDENHPRTIISSRIDAFTVNIVDGKQSIRLLDSIRDSIESAAPSLDPFPFCYPFLYYDGLRVIVWETIRNVIMAGIGVFIVNVFVLASIPMAFIVVSMVALTDIMLFGYMWYVDQAFNPVTAINLVLAVGIAVDYSAHIAHSFLVVTGDRTSRAQQALEHIGGEVLSGAFTTWLGVIMMGFAEHYAFNSFFKMLFAIVVAGAWHGLVFLPVILSLIGSPPYQSRLG